MGDLFPMEKVAVIVTLYRDSIAVTEENKDRLMVNFHPVKITLTDWIVPFGLCKLLFL